MTYFLERIASHIFEKYGDSIDRQCLVFPNRRAGLYFMKYLSVAAGKPIWAPSVKTINELFTSFSDLQVAGSETLVFELYISYCKLNKEPGSFDDFYFWGEMLVNDFDNVDKYLVNAGSLFANLADLKKIDKEFGDLGEEQIKIIRQFWVNFNSGSSSREKSEFMTLWSILPDLYTVFRDSLRAKGIAYEGMIFRDIAESCLAGRIPEFQYESFHFTGFNALNNCEKTLMRSLAGNDLAKFYWDYDESTVKDDSRHSAGFFLRENLKDFGNDMPADWNYKTFVSDTSARVQRTIIDTSTDVAQVKLVPALLKEIEDVSGDEAHHTAIVLAEESLLIPLLSSIPEYVEDVNITMGYPLKFSPVYSLIKHLLSLQKNSRQEGEDYFFDSTDVINILHHSYLNSNEQADAAGISKELVSNNEQWISATRFSGKQVLGNIFVPVRSPVALHEYLKSIVESLYKTEGSEGLSDQGINRGNDIRNEFIYRTIQSMNRLENALSGSAVQLTANTYSRLIDKVLRSVSIPFSGEPLYGIQIMGILETRALDFKNLIILSVNEGILPRSSAGSSCIPYNLREAFGLPVIRHQDSIYSYYFYRLLQRAEKVTFVYNSNAEGLKTGEMSRFLLQLDYLNDIKPDYKSPGYEIISRGLIPSILARTRLHSEKLESLFLKPGSKALSPSAINTWLNCRMRFYYRYVCGLMEPEKIVTGTDPSVFGKLLHRVMERVYSPFEGKTISRAEMEDILNDSTLISKTAGEAISEIFLSRKQFKQGGNDEIISGILSSYVRMIINHDCSFAPLKISGLEKYISSSFNFEQPDRKSQITIGGYTDRIDETGGTRRIIDYKTGNTPMEIRSVSSLFDENDEKRNDAWFQILMYCEMLSCIEPAVKVRPALYAVRSMSSSEFSDILVISEDRNKKHEVNDYSVIRTEYVKGLEQTIANIFSEDSEFRMTEHHSKCDYCPYTKLCRR